MNRREEIDKAAKAFVKKMVDEGRLIEAGWVGFQLAAYPDGTEDEQGRQLRWAFFAGAQHLFGSTMDFMDPGTEPTADDLRRMSLIEHEFRAFLHEFKEAHGITDPDIGPIEETRQ